MMPTNPDTLEQTPARNDNVDELWKVIGELQNKVHELEKYKTFHDMLRLANTPNREEL